MEASAIENDAAARKAIADHICALFEGSGIGGDHFIFKTAPEALDGGVIIAVALSRHGSHQTASLENGAICFSAVLTTAV